LSRTKSHFVKHYAKRKVKNKVKRDFVKNKVEDPPRWERPTVSSN
jgi:hypothetical protein